MGDKHLNQLVGYKILLLGSSRSCLVNRADIYRKGKCQAESSMFEEFVLGIDVFNYCFLACFKAAPFCGLLSKSAWVPQQQATQLYYYQGRNKDPSPTIGLYKNRMGLLELAIAFINQNLTSAFFF